MDTAPAIGTAVRFREDFGPIGKAKTVFTVNTEPGWDNTRQDGQQLQFVGLKTTDGHAAYRTAYIRDLIPA